MILDATYILSTVAYGAPTIINFLNYDPAVLTGGITYTPYFLPGARPRLLRMFLQGYLEAFGPIGNCYAGAGQGTWVNARWYDGASNGQIRELGAYPTFNAALPLYFDESGNMEFNLPYFQPMVTANNFVMRLDGRVDLAAGATNIANLSIIARWEVATDSVILL